MGGERVNISQIATKVSVELFAKFGWSISGPTDENFPCDKTEEHGKEEAKSHPTDVAFQYDDPYEPKRIYLLTDLKSYAKDSITKAQLKGALRELSKAVDCASISPKWREKFANSDVERQIHGLLFVYNHDGKFDGDFHSFFLDAAPKKLSLPNKTKIFVIGPAKIGYLLTLLTDLKGLTAERQFPFFDKVPLMYPDRIRRFAKHSTSEVGRIELLLGPLQVVPYDFIPTSVSQKETASRKVGYNIYYERDGSSPAEFEFLFDFCFRNQMVKDNVVIDFRMPYAHANALQNFKNARESFSRNFYSSPDIEARLQQFKATPVAIKEQIFLAEHIGMERRQYG